MGLIIYARKNNPSETGVFVLADPKPHTLATLLEKISVDETIPKGRRADICSAVRTLCKALGLQPERTLADTRIIAAHLRHITPASVHLSERRLQNCKSLMTTALAYAEIEQKPVGLRRTISPPFRKLLDLAPTRWDVFALSRLFVFASAQGFQPNNIDDHVFDQFLKHLELTCLKDFRRLDLKARKAWNKLSLTTPNWPQQKITVPRYDDRWALPWTAFPENLRLETEAYLESRRAKAKSNLEELLSEEELFGDDECEANPASLKDSTADLVRYRIRQFASALVISGLLEPEDVKRLAVLVTPATVAKGLKFFIERNKGQNRNSQINGIARDLLMIAKLFVKSPPKDLNNLARISSRTRPIHDGLPESARRSLAPFRDMVNVRAFLAMPRTVVAEIQKQKTIDSVIANRMAAALWIKIAQRAPLRISDLMSIDIQKDIMRSHEGKNASVALLVKTQKTGKLLEIPLPQETVRILDLYLSKYRKELVKVPCSWLFPRPDGEHKTSHTMSADIQRLMKNSIGFSINPHSFRHVAAKLYLTAFPGRYTDVQIMLGHRSLKTTTQYYCELEAEEVFKHFDAVMLKLESSLPVGGDK